MVPVIIVILALAQIPSISNAQNLKLLAEWKELEFEFPSNIVRESAIRSGEYTRGQAVPIDVDVDYRDNDVDQRKTRIFITVPRFVDGIPITLGLLSNARGTGGPLLQPYPNYSWNSNQGRNCDGLTSVFRVAIDECQRLWVLDTGRIGNNQFCMPQLLAFNLNNDKLIHRYRFPASQVFMNVSLFITPVVDVRDPPPIGTCSNTMVYIADVSSFAIYVFDLRRNLSWRTQNKLTFPHPHYGTFTIAGETFDLMDGIFGLALSPKVVQQPNSNRKYGNGNGNGRPGASDRMLYFHSLASVTENRVPLRILDNNTAWESNQDYEPRSFVEIGSRGIQSPAEAMDRYGNLFFGLDSPIGIGCWDSSKPYKRDNIKVVVENAETLQFISGMKVVLNKKAKEELWVLSCRFQKVMTGSMNRNEINFRIQALPTEELLGGTKCVAGQNPSRSDFGFPTN